MLYKDVPKDQNGKRPEAVRILPQRLRKESEDGTVTYHMPKLPTLVSLSRAVDIPMDVFCALDYTETCNVAYIPSVTTTADEYIIIQNRETIALIQALIVLEDEDANELYGKLMASLLR